MMFYVEVVLGNLLSCIDAGSYLSYRDKYERVVEVIRGLCALITLENMLCEVDENDEV